MDATLAALRDVDNPDLYELFPMPVPIFKPHKRFDDEGNLLYEVTEQTLGQIATKTNEMLTENGVLPKVQIGHTRDKAKETEQPPIVGYAKNIRVGTFGPKAKPCLVADFYFRKEKRDIPTEYRYRSVEYYPARKQISAISLLARDPELDLGLVHFAKSGHEQCFFYSLGGNAMAEEKEKEHTEADDVPGEHEKKESDIDEKESEHFMRYARHHFPHLEKMHEEACHKYGGMPSSTNVSVPGAAAHLKGASQGSHTFHGTHHMQKLEKQGDERVDYEKQIADLKAENTSQASRLAELEKRDRMYTYERTLSELEREGVIFNMKDELEFVADMPAELFTKHAQRMKANYQRRPARGANFIPLAPADTGNPKATTPDQNRRAISLATKKGIEYDDALAQVKAAS